MTLPLSEASYPSPDEIRDSLVRAVRYAYARRGIARNVLPGSDDYVRLEKLAARVGIAIAANGIAAADADPLTALGDKLRRLAALFGVFPRPAAGGAGAVSGSFSGAALTLPSSWTGTAPNGRKYTAAPGTYATGATIPVSAISTGAETNQLAGVTITWDSAAIGALSPTATVTSAGITGGANADGDDELRARLLQRLAAAAGGGNWSELVQWGLNASASVEAAYEYDAASGPGSFHLVVTKAGGNRTLPLAIVQAVAAYVRARMPGQAEGTFTSVAAQHVDIVLAARLPLPQLAGGQGGGWLDAAPWPREDCKVTAYNAGTGVATVNSTAAPPVGAAIGIWDATYEDPATGDVGRMLTYAVATVSGSAGAWTITVQSGFAVSPLGAWVSAGAVSLVSYARAFADQVAVLGPGEVTGLPELLPRAARQPAPDARSPSDLTNRLLGVLETTFPEILDVNYTRRAVAGGSTSLVSPSLPATTADPPRILVLASFALRAA